jgi:AcrR family transcriptional regulator
VEQVVSECGSLSGDASDSNHVPARLPMTPKDTREHLIDVGFQLIHSSGYAATRVAHAGVAKESFYHHFTSKQAFTEQVLLRYAATELERSKTSISEKRFVHSTA